MEEETDVSSPSPASDTAQNPTFLPIVMKKSKNNGKLKLRKKKVCILKVGSDPTTSSSSSGVVCRRRGARLSLGARRSAGFADVDAVALPLGMSFAAVVAQVLEREDSTGERMSTDHLSLICTSAVGEALSNVRKILSWCLISSLWLYKVFSCKFNRFINNFEKSFRSTLKTLRLLSESSSLTKDGSWQNTEFSTFELAPSELVDRGDLLHNSSTREARDYVALEEEVKENLLGHNEDGDRSLGDQGKELACFSDSRSQALIGQPVFSTFQRSVIEQRRSNNLKELELSLSFRKMQLKETQLSLSNDANELERSKLAMGISKASFRAEKFKNQLEDVRHAELLRKCIDCLVAGLLIMSLCLAYGAYVFSYRRITEATASCAPLTRGSKSWWIPQQVASFNSGFQMLSCQVQVLSRMLFGILMILAIAYLLLQRSVASNQTMPVTFLLLLLGVACGFAGKLCVDTLGGSGYHWLFFWEAICLVHFFSNVCTPSLFLILHGPLAVSQGMKSDSTMIPYWVRRSIFYGIVLVVLPLLCGLVPFGGYAEWKEHFALLMVGRFSDDDDGDWS